MTHPLIVLKKLCREHTSGGGSVFALRDVDLIIEAGEMVAILGASGSGKSTLMNILGCLDRPTSGSYFLSGRNTSLLNMEELAELRRRHFGFVFQRYHLLPELTALDNVEMPAIYAGLSPRDRRESSLELLERLGMTDRIAHRPGELSGGQQQRVSIARALMNGADVILADEPTGALDSKNGNDVLRILEELHAEGRTVIVVTHDLTIASRADRTIELRDGVVVQDRKKPNVRPLELALPRHFVPEPPLSIRLRRSIDRFREALRMALLSMMAHRLRTILTMLGIIIGVASVVCVVALGEGSQKKVLSNISNLGTNTLEAFPGKDFGDVRSSKITTLVIADARALAQQAYVAAVTPTVSTSTTLRFGSIEASAQVNGVGQYYFDVKGTKLGEGVFFDDESVRELAQDVVIDDNTRKALFRGFTGSPLGQVILVGSVPCRILGVTRAQQGGFASSANPSVYLPYTTVQARFLGNSSLRSISVRIKDSTGIDVAEQALTQFLKTRHGAKDFFILNTDDIRRTITSTTQALTLLVAAIAVISLLVGGIGVMNIMLVSVSERVGEIGVRMAVGARRGDILQQFLIEAVLVCLIGGLLGIGLSLVFGIAFNASDPNFTLIYSTGSIVAALLCSTVIGVVFGYLPARNASLLDPVAALTRE